MGKFPFPLHVSYTLLIYSLAYVDSYSVIFESVIDGRESLDSLTPCNTIRPRITTWGPDLCTEKEFQYIFFLCLRAKRFDAEKREDRIGKNVSRVS